MTTKIQPVLMFLLSLILAADVGFSQRLPPFGNLHPLNLGESHCGPDISLNSKDDQTMEDEMARFSARQRLNQHLVYRDSNFFNRKRWDTGRNLS